MDKKKVWFILGFLITILAATTYLVITLAIGGNGRNGTDSSGIPFATFFVIFILPGIIAQKKRREQWEKKNYRGGI
jgi:hypothetical protein